MIALIAGPGFADTVIATRTIRPQQLVSASDVRIDPTTVEGAHQSLGEVIGQEARIALYPGRAVMHGAVGEPALIDRNQVVELVYSTGGLRIVAEGRALGRGGIGERIRVMNTGSRTVLFGQIAPDGSVLVTK
ncbi:flagellar basal body P-ring formation chaperone FlgA [Tropicibacter oceani]|uniref:Flagella basal body P-ring formation protein FlgA n=1 Tax=Tropicibacter oceani TaxID=3058420 RepID=A0ABY8QJH5_9RHOB|nr:flagellar basal body P-ring formation chaperone FlgA [Tropicibacter oceani]WGW04660.1 flagellar basal body P-ring formation chaperone FlgA [Tropicibacter oceani]